MSSPDPLDQAGELRGSVLQLQPERIDSGALALQVEGGQVVLGEVDFVTAEGQMALGLWAGNQILAALHAPVKRDRG